MNPFELVGTTVTVGDCAPLLPAAAAELPPRGPRPLLRLLVRTGEPVTDAGRNDVSAMLPVPSASSVGCVDNGSGGGGGAGGGGAGMDAARVKKAAVWLTLGTGSAAEATATSATGGVGIDAGGSGDGEFVEGTVRDGGGGGGGGGGC